MSKKKKSKMRRLTEAEYNAYLVSLKDDNAKGGGTEDAASHSHP